MKDREFGYYWVKVYKNSKWKIGHYIYGAWTLPSNVVLYEFEEKDIYEINENRILSPDETPEPKYEIKDDGCPLMGMSY